MHLKVEKLNHWCSWTENPVEGNLKIIHKSVHNITDFLVCVQNGYLSHNSLITEPVTVSVMFGACSQLKQLITQEDSLTSNFQESFKSYTESLWNYKTDYLPDYENMTKYGQNKIK